MHAVSNAGDRHFVDWNAGPHIFPKRSSNFTVQFADAVGVAAKTQRQDGHAERIIRIEPGLAKREQLVKGMFSSLANFPNTFASSRARTSRCRRAPECAW